MGTTRIKVIDLASDVEQIKTSRKRAQTAAFSKIKKSLVREKKPEKPEEEKLPQQPILGVEPAKEEVEKGIVKKIPQTTKISKPKFTKAKGKKYQNAKLLIDPAKFYHINAALELVKKINIAKFDGSVEAHLVTKQKGLAGFVTFPYPVKKQSKVLVFTSAKDGLEGAGVTIGTEETIGEIETKKLVPKKDFTLVISTPSFMPKLAKLGKILGPAGLMPNPKAGTVAEKPAEVIKKFTQGRVEFKTQADNPVIHCVIGKVSQDVSQLKENLQALVTAINLQRIQKLYLAPTMGPSVKVDTSTLLSVNPE